MPTAGRQWIGELLCYSRAILRRSEQEVSRNWTARKEDLVLLHILFEELRYTRTSQLLRATSASLLSLFGGNMGTDFVLLAT